MQKSQKIYVNLAGLLKEPIVDVAFSNPDAILHFFDMRGGFHATRLNATSVDYARRAMPVLTEKMFEPTWLFGLLGGGVNTSSLLYQLYLPGHSGWELATIVTNATFSAKTTFYNGTQNYSFDNYRQIVKPILLPSIDAKGSSDKDKKEL
jgi:hypothetical protein